MAFRPPNYNQQRNDRQRAKDQKKREKLQRREDEAAARREAREGLQSGPETSNADDRDD